MLQTGRERLDPAQPVGIGQDLGVILPSKASVPGIAPRAEAASGSLTHSTPGAVREASRRSGSSSG
jgi:hypothetical protein